MPPEMPPPMDIEQQSAMHREAPETPAPLVSMRGNEVLIQQPVETPEEYEYRVERREARLMDKATEVVVSYVLREGLLVEIEPKDLVARIRASELFINELAPLIHTACEGETVQDHTPTSVSPYVSVRTDRDGDVIETIHGFHIQPAVSLLTDPTTKKAWKYDYIYDFQDSDTWQRLFPGTQPTLAQQAEAERMMTEAQAAASDLQKEWGESRSREYFEPTPERMAKVESVLQGLNIDPDELAETMADSMQIQELLYPSKEQKPFDGNAIRKMAFRALTSEHLSPDDVKRGIDAFRNSAREMGEYRDYISSIPAEKRTYMDFYVDFKKQFGDEALKTLVTFKGGLSVDGISDRSIASRIHDVEDLEGAQEEARAYLQAQTQNEQP